MRVLNLSIAYKASSSSFGGNNSAGIDWGYLNGVPCPICGQQFISQGQQEKWHEEAGKLTGAKLSSLIIDTFDKFDDTTFPEKRALDRISRKIKESRNNHLLKEYYTKIRNELKPKLSKEYSDQLSGCLDYFVNINKSGKRKLPPYIIKEVVNFIEKQQELLKSDKVNKLIIPAKKLKYLEKIINEKYVDNLKKEEYIEILKQSSLFSKKMNSKCEDLIFWWSNRTGDYLIQRLVRPFLTTSEHVYPKSKKNSFSQNEINSICNYLPTHERCNTLRGDSSWQELIKKGVTTFARIENCIKKMQSQWKYVSVTDEVKPSYQKWQEKVRVMLNADLDRYWEDERKTEQRHVKRTKNNRS